MALLYWSEDKNQQRTASSDLPEDAVTPERRFLARTGRGSF
jgi:hypothetical protein